MMGKMTCFLLYMAVKAAVLFRKCGIYALKNERRNPGFCVNVGLTAVFTTVTLAGIMPSVLSDRSVP